MISYSFFSGVPAAYGDDTDKNKNSGIVMKDLNGDQVDHSVGPRGDLYAKVSKRGKSPNTKIDNPAIAYGAVDNENFVAESDGAYEPVDVKPAKEESPKASPANTKKVIEYNATEEDDFLIYDASSTFDNSSSSDSCMTNDSESFTIISRV